MGRLGWVNEVRGPAVDGKGGIYAENSTEIGVFKICSRVCNEDWITLKSIHVIAQGIPLVEVHQVSFPHECRHFLSSSQSPHILLYHDTSPSFLVSAAHPSLPVCTGAAPAAQSAPSASHVELG